MKWVLRLFPADWRARYGLELEALLADRPAGPGDTLDLASTAIRLRLAEALRKLPRRLRAPRPARLSPSAVLTAIAIIALLPAVSLGVAHVLYRVVQIAPFLGDPDPFCGLKHLFAPGGMTSEIVGFGSRLAFVIAASALARPSLARAVGGVSVSVRIGFAWLPLVVLAVSIALMTVYGPFPVSLWGFGSSWEGFCLAA